MDSLIEFTLSLLDKLPLWGSVIILIVIVSVIAMIILKNTGANSKKNVYSNIRQSGRNNKLQIGENISTKDGL